MAFTGNEDHSFPLETAVEWTANYRAANPGSSTNPTTLAHYFGKAAISEIFGQTGCVGFRAYYALNDTGEKQLIITGVDADGNDLYEGLLAERSVVCPPNCGAYSPLRE